MSEPLNEKDSAKALALKVIEDVFRAIEMVVEVHETLSRLPEPSLNFGGNKQYNLVQLSYLNDSIIPIEKALK